ncbi:MAG TPA: STAS domain-containing protein [Vicinamibacterales bacterium]|jgi:stage II sporulation protein AA (anti-sigma F factor antagonist)|nr:STAS domain-containing protein [Vicinamibacterales bacterium]
MTDAHRWGLTVTRSGGPETVTVSVTGRVSNATSANLEEALEQAAAGAREVVLDLAGVDYVSSAGLQVLARASERLAGSGGRLVLAAAQPPVRVALELAGFRSN